MFLPIGSYGGKQGNILAGFMASGFHSNAWTFSPISFRWLWHSLNFRVWSMSSV